MQIKSVIKVSTSRYILAQLENKLSLLYKIHLKSILLKQKFYERINLLCSSWNGMIFWCHNCNSSPPVNNLVPSKFHDKEVMFDSVCRLPVWTHLYSNCCEGPFRRDFIKYVLKCKSKNVKQRNASIQTCEQVLCISGVGSKMQTWFS